MKKCKRCLKEFIPRHESRGQEQVYCTVKCRQKDANERTKQKFINQILNEEKSIKTNNVEIEKKEITLFQISEQEKISGINRFIQWLLESDEKLSNETILKVAKLFSWEEKFYYDHITWKPSNLFKKNETI